MRDDSTVRLNAAGAPDDGSSRTEAVEAEQPAFDVVDDGSADPTERHPAASAGGRAIEAVTKVSPRAAEDGHIPGPGLVIPPAARERPEPPQPPADRPVMPAPPTRAASAPPAASATGRPAGPSPTVDGSDPAPSPGERTTRTAAPPHRAGGADVRARRDDPHRQHRNVAAARPTAPPRPAGPRPTGPRRPLAPAARTSAGPSRAAGAARTPHRTAAPPARRRAGGIAGGLALGLVALAAASYTVLVPPVRDEVPAVAAPAGPAAPAVRWIRTNGDEFDGPSVDRDRWNVYDSVGGFGNGLRRPSAVGQRDGLLTVTARPRLNGGTSGGIAMGKGQLHGRWEFRARADPGVGYSPAVLLWPDSERFPIDGELDMLESPQGDRRTASAYVHYGTDNKTRGAQVSGDFTQWHTFAFEWLPDRLTWYVDGQKAWEVRDRAVIPTTPMHLCIQLDQGPAVKFMPGPDASTPDAVRMQVDWARQYRAG